jgi:magnesium transporter
VLRILTVFGAIFLPLTFLSGIFGMNVDFPGEGTAAAFWVIAGTMLVTLLGLLAFFRWKRWL